MAQDCPDCGCPVYGHPSYNPMTAKDVIAQNHPQAPPQKMVYRFNCPECGNMWESDTLHDDP